MRNHEVQPAVLLANHTFNIPVDTEREPHHKLKPFYLTVFSSINTF